MSIYVAFAPVLILEDPRDVWQLSHFNVVEYFSIFLMLDTILQLIFLGPIAV
jgi:hypothetical protein